MTTWRQATFGIALGAVNVQPNCRKNSGRPAQKRRRRYRRDSRPGSIEVYDPLEVPPTKLLEGRERQDTLWRVVLKNKFTPLVRNCLIEAKSIGEASIKMREFMTLGDSIHSIREAKV